MEAGRAPYCPSLPAHSPLLLNVPSLPAATPPPVPPAKELPALAAAGHAPPGGPAVHSTAQGRQGRRWRAGRREISRSHTLLAHWVPPLQQCSTQDVCLPAGHSTSPPALPHLAVERGSQLAAVGRRGVGKVGGHVCELCHRPRLLSLLHMVAEGVMVEAGVSSHAVLQ